MILKIYTIIMARKKPLQSQQLATGMLNNFGGSGKDGEQKSSSVNDETEKEKELRIEIQRLYRQLEEMRSLSMRIANPHLIQKGKTRFIYPTKKKAKASAAAKSEIEFSRAVASVHEPELQSLIESNQPVKPKKTAPHVSMADPIEAVNVVPNSASISGPSSSAAPVAAAQQPLSASTNKSTKGCAK